MQSQGHLLSMVILTWLSSLPGRVAGGCLGAGRGGGSCPAPPFRSPPEDIEHPQGCPQWADCCTEYGFCHPRSDWLARRFRDCNGESNGLPLSASVLTGERFCDGNSSQVGGAGGQRTSRERLVTTSPRYSLGGYSRGEKSLKIFSKAPELGRRNNSPVRSWSSWSSSGPTNRRRNLRLRGGNRNLNISCEFDTVRGGCRERNVTVTPTTTAPRRLTGVRALSSTSVTTTAPTSTVQTTSVVSTSLSTQPEEFTTVQTVTSSSFKKTSLVNFRLRKNQIKEEIKKLMESKLNQNNRHVDNNRHANVDNNRHVNLDNNRHAKIDNNRHVKVKNTTSGTKKDNEVEKLRRAPNKLRFPKIRKFKKVEEISTESDDLNEIQSPSSSQTPRKKGKKNKAKMKSVKKKNYPHSWDGPTPDCSWDGPGACNVKEPDDNNEVKTKVIIEKSRFSNLLPKRLELKMKNDIQEERSVSISTLDEDKPDGFDRSKLLPGKTIKQRIKEHLKQREKEKRNQSRVSFSSSPRPGIVSTVKSSRTPRRRRKEVVGVELYSVEEWLRMG